MLPLAGAAVLLHPSWRSRAIEHGLALSDAASEWMFDHARRAPTFSDGEVTPFDRFPLNSYLVHDPEIDLDAWRLEVSGLVARPGQYGLDALRALPRVTQNTRHICIEGWDVIGSFGGVRLSELLALVGADPRARFLEVACADDYYESVDMASARHPQSLMCDEMYGQPLTREHGAPLRLILPTKLGYKQAKYIVSLRVSDVLGSKRGYWVDQGYSWFGDFRGARVRGCESASVRRDEHPVVVRLCHWAFALALGALIGSGLEVFAAFPAFGEKIPQADLFVPPSALRLGGWLGGALQWHFTSAWLLTAAMVIYLAYQIVSRNGRQVLFVARDLRGVWPMARHYLLFGPKPTVTETYNPLQKMAYSVALLLIVVSIVTGFALYKPVQLSWLVDVLGGFRLTRVWHFAAMCGLLAFIPGHLVMVALHGWRNFAGMWTGGKRQY